MSQDQRTVDEDLDRVTEVRTPDRSAPQPQGRFELSMAQIMAGALAAASAAVAASWLGLAGTVLGAVIASIVVPVSTALYKHPLERSSQVIRESLPLRPVQYRSADDVTTPRSTTFEPERAEPRTGSTGRMSRRGIRWGVVAISCLLTLAVGFGMLTALEKVMGGSFSSLTGSGGHQGTTVGRLVHQGGSGSSDTKPADSTDPNNTGGAPSATPTTADAPTTDPATTDPATDPAT
nr:hypothetical protein [Propionibacteriales bacterium]